MKSSANLEQESERIDSSTCEHENRIQESAQGNANVQYKPKYREAVEGFSQLALGFSIVIAIAFGVGIGLFLRQLFGVGWLLWLGVFWGVGAAILNVYKAYKQQFNVLEQLKDDPKYSYKVRD